LLHSGEQFDTGLQQYYLRARYYNPNNGRFNRLDPFAGNNFDPQSLHKYGYAHGDPINGSDPSGEAEIDLTSVVDAIGSQYHYDLKPGEQAYLERQVESKTTIAKRSLAYRSYDARLNDPANA
jgi:RHS repeat-associated protein